MLFSGNIYNLMYSFMHTEPLINVFQLEGRYVHVQVSLWKKS